MGEQPEETTATASLRGAVGAQRRDVYLTGFGKFGDIVENPTTYIVQEIAHDKNVTDALVLEVSAEGSVEMLKSMRAKAEASGRPCIFLHIGVNAGASKFALEQVGYNVADFRIPDERGWVAQGETITQDEGASLTTALPLEDMLASLRNHTELVEISTDPGRYICNYVYFHSLRWAKQQLANGDKTNEHYALFLHVPKFEVIPIEDQVAFVRKLIALVADL